MEATSKQEISDADRELARLAGLTKAMPGTGTQDAAMATFAAAVRAPLLARLELAGAGAAVMGTIGIGFGEENAKLRTLNAEMLAMLHQIAESDAEAVAELKDQGLAIPPGWMILTNAVTTVIAKATQPVIQHEPAAEKILTPEAQADRDAFNRTYGDGNCSCHLSPPCNSCVHPGNPANQAEDDECWTEDTEGGAL